MSHSKGLTILHTKCLTQCLIQNVSLKMSHSKCLTQDVLLKMSPSKRGCFFLNCIFFTNWT